MNKTQASRLLTLAYFLKTQVPKENFDMETVIHQTDESIPPEKQLQEGFCGTTACAMGWCPIVFPKDWRYTMRHSILSLRGPSNAYWEHEAESYFGLTDYEVIFLFGGEKQRTPKQEAREIEKMVAKHGYEYAD